MANFINGWPILKRLLRYSLYFKKKIILAFLLLCIASSAETLGPVLISYFINTILTKHILQKKIITIIICSYLITQTASIIINYLQILFFKKVAIQIVQILRLEVMSVTLLQPLRFFHKQPIGKIVSTITNDTEIIKELYDTVLTTMFKSIILICMTLIAMFILQWKMAIISTIMFPLLILVILIYQHYSTSILRMTRIYLAKINHEFNEIINGISIIQQYSQEYYFRKIIKNTSKLHYQAKIAALKLDSLLLRPLISLFFSIILCGLLILFSSSPIHTISIGTLYAFISYLNRLTEPVITIATQQFILQQAIVSGERIFKIIDSEQQKYGCDISPIKKGSIKISNLSFRYQQKSPMIINKINLYIKPNSFISIIGRTGSGKSTLINLLMGYYKSTTGIIYIDHRPLFQLSYHVLRNGVYMIPQEPIIFTGTIQSNITLGKKIPEEKIWNILKIIKLDSFVKSLPKKLNFILGEKGNNLSIGQKQLLSIARILLFKPKILILDEVTANIDAKTEKTIHNILTKLNKTSTLIVIAHKLSTIIKSDNIVVLKNGKIVEIGNHKKLIQKQGIYYNMYNIK